VIMRFLTVLAALALLALLLTGLTQVQPGEIAVVRRFGHVRDYKPGPGLYVGLPWGIDRVDRVKVDEVRRISAGYLGGESSDPEITPPGQLLTGRHNLVNVGIVIDYKVIPEEVVDFVVQADRVEPLIERAAETALAEWIAGREIDVVLLRGKRVLPQWLVEQTQERIKPYRLGVQITDAGVTYLSAPAEVKAYFDDVTRAEIGAGQRKNVANLTATKSWSDSLAEKNAIERQTASYANEKRVMAEAEAENFTKRLEQYRRLGKGNPAFLNALWWDEMCRLYARLRENGRIDVLDNHLGANGLDITQVPLLPRNKK
jgi:modulator of FtsH protease HflK